MSTPANWSAAMARQADADFTTWNVLQPNAAIPVCHKLMLLQMACEKLCKAHLLASGSSTINQLDHSHGYIAGPLPVIIRQEITATGAEPKKMGGLVQLTRVLASEIEILNPAVQRAGRRPDNCEYPWEDHQGHLHSPLDSSFATTSMLTAKHARTFLKFVRSAINRLLPRSG